MQRFTHEEEFEIIQQAQAANQAGDYEKAVEITKRLPLAPHLAKAAKEIWGKDYLLQSGFDLSEAEAEYGTDWLNR